MGGEGGGGGGGYTTAKCFDVFHKKFYIFAKEWWRLGGFAMIVSYRLSLKEYYIWRMGSWACHNIWSNFKEVYHVVLNLWITSGYLKAL